MESLIFHIGDVLIMYGEEAITVHVKNYSVLIKTSDILSIALMEQLEGRQREMQSLIIITTENKTPHHIYFIKDEKNRRRASTLIHIVKARIEEINRQQNSN
jgi:hypothetical protein